MLGMSMSLLRTRRRLDIKVADSAWFAARLDRLVAYCGHATLRTRCSQTAPLLEDVDEAWTSPCYQSIDTSASQRLATGDVAIVCSRCFNHCVECVYNCQTGCETLDDVLAVDDLQDGVDAHRPLRQTMTVMSCEAGSARRRWRSGKMEGDGGLQGTVQRGVLTLGAHCPLTVMSSDTGSARRRWRSGKKGSRRKARVVGSDKLNGPRWPAVLLTYDRGLSDSFREKRKAETQF